MVDFERDRVLIASLLLQPLSLPRPLSSMSGLFGTASSAQKPSPYASSRHHNSSSSARAPPSSGPSQLSPDQQQEVREAFELFDLDKDQKLDYHEFKVALRALGFDLKKAEVLKLMRDRNHDDGQGGGLTIGLDGFMGIGASSSLDLPPLPDASGES